MKYLIVILALIISLPTSVRGQSNVQIGGILSLLEHFDDDPARYNTMFRGDSPFSPVRARIFLNSWVHDHVGVFVQIWFDEEADPGYGGMLRIEAAYAAFTDIGHPGLGFKVGKIPLTTGRFVERSYADKNPVIGTPLMYSYRTALPKNLSLTSGILTPGTNSGYPVSYEACWPVGLEHFGQLGRFDYALAVINGSMSDPRGSTRNGAYQYLGRIGYRPHVSLNLGFNTARGAYPGSLPDVRTSQGEQADEYLQKYWGLDFEYSRGSIDIISEYAHNDWDVYFTADGNVTARSWYVDAKWKFIPGWYLAVRGEQMLFSSELMDNQPEAKPGVWDYDVTRVEAGIGYHMTRSILAKLVEQVNRFPDASGRNTNTTAVQLNITF